MDLTEFSDMSAEEIFTALMISVWCCANHRPELLVGDAMLESIDSSNLSTTSPMYCIMHLPKEV
jgi:hypothetical protein